jgi:hypothetical protein
MKKYAACLLSLLLWAPFASANTFTTDLSDLWWNSSESGWGVTATHQREIVFLSFYVYGIDNRPTFYVSETIYAGQAPSGALIFSGQMIQTTGPWLGATFNPNLVTRTPVGTVTFTAFVDAATLSYSVNGTVVTKELTRFTFRNNDLSGSYAGVFNETYSACMSPSQNGTVESGAVVTMVNSANALTMTTNQNGFVCNFSGNYRQSGRMGSSTGTYVCPGVSGTYDMLEIEANTLGITARYTAHDNVCALTTTRFGMVRR